MAITDHGPELLSATPIDRAGRLRTQFAQVNRATLRDGVLAFLNAGKLARQRFRHRVHRRPHLPEPLR